MDTDNWHTDPAILSRELRLIAEAKSAIGQCCLALGDARTNQILTELSGIEQELRDHLDAGNPLVGWSHG